MNRGQTVVVDLTDRGHGKNVATILEVLGSNKLHDYIVQFGSRKVYVTESQVSSDSSQQ